MFSDMALIGKGVSFPTLDFLSASCLLSRGKEKAEPFVRKKGNRKRTWYLVS